MIFFPTLPFQQIFAINHQILKLNESDYKLYNFLYLITKQYKFCLCFGFAGIEKLKVLCRNDQQVNIYQLIRVLFLNSYRHSNSFKNLTKLLGFFLLFFFTYLFGKLLQVAYIVVGCGCMLLFWQFL